MKSIHTVRETHAWWEEKVHIFKPCLMVMSSSVCFCLDSLSYFISQTQSPWKWVDVWSDFWLWLRPHEAWQGGGVTGPSASACIWELCFDKKKERTIVFFCPDSLLVMLSVCILVLSTDVPRCVPCGKQLLLFWHRNLSKINIQRQHEPQCKHRVCVQQAWGSQ